MTSFTPAVPERTVLPNGLTVLFEHLAHAPVVAMQAWVRAGGADETPEVLGVAHLHEHMLFKGTLRRGVGEIARQVEAAGGEINAWTSYDETVYHLTMDRAELDLGVDILADALRESAFDAGELARESEVVVEEIRRAQDSPARRLHQAMFSRMFAQHPYGRPVLGYERTVKAMTREQILTFYRTYYRPDNVTFLVVGDVSREAALEAVRLRLGEWAPSPQIPGGQSAPLARPKRPQQGPAAAAAVHVLAEDVRESRLALAWLGPNLASPKVAAFDVLAMVLGHGDTSRLFGALMRDTQMVFDVHAYAYTPRDHGVMWVGAGLKTPAAAPVVAVIMRELERLCQTPVAPGELERARTAILSDAAFQRESMQGQARKRGFFEVTGGDWRMEEAYLDAVRALTPHDLMGVAREVLAQPATCVVQCPEDAAAQVGELAEIAKRIEARPAGGSAEVAEAAPSAPEGGAGPAQAAVTARRATAGAQVVRRVLDCGATLVCAPEKGPVVALRAVAVGGQRWETPATAGHMGLFGRLFGQATQQRDSQRLAEALGDLGGGLGGYAGRNSMGLQGAFIAERAGPGCALFAEALATPAWHRDDLERERSSILEAIRVREDSPQSLAMDLFHQSVYAGHPFGQRFLGTPESVAGVDAGVLEALWQRFMAPPRLVISVVGDVDPDWVADFFDARLPKTRAATLPTPKWQPAAPVPHRHLPLKKQQSQVVVGAPGLTLTHPDRFAAEVATTVLSGQGGRLFTDLRDRHSLAYSVYCGSAPGLDAGHIMAFIATHPDKVPQATEGLRRHLEDLCRTPAAEEELARAKRSLIGGHAIGLQTSAARAMTMALDEAYGLGWAAHRGYAEAIDRTTAQGVMAVSARLLSSPRLVEVVVGP